MSFDVAKKVFLLLLFAANIGSSRDGDRKEKEATHTAFVFFSRGRELLGQHRSFVVCSLSAYNSAEQYN